MGALTGITVGLAGALDAFPRRIAARAVGTAGGSLRRGVGRGTGLVVFGRGMLRRWDAARIGALLDEATAVGAQPVSETGLLRRLGLLDAAPDGPHDAEALARLSGLAERDVRLLALFDAFEADTAPFTFRDLILARKYAALTNAGAGWDTIARAVHRVPDVGALAALTLDLGSEGIVARRPGWQGTLDGQGTLGLVAPEEDADDLFDAAGAAEEEGDWDRAAQLYNRCLTLDPSDGVAAFNRANCLAALGRAAEAAHDYARAVKRDPRFADAWFNLARLMSDAGHEDAARRHLSRALTIDPAYADAMFNLARLEYEAGNGVEAARLWRAYLEHDADGEWAQRARNGLALIALERAAAG
ncbi:tetratricopeptide repeat protein [Wenxinia marina]|uniref:TPR repeat protein/Tetratricopeptide repeat protein n=1 Tax=Wenxinia marina DSM 24838 TaxID=1123501 RepID=A0A0D0QCI0_9RHOB|nr:tetratricopeptide repeat protein [Wenxinia marina]KIQ70032.1 TPR repeat protein/Tetratricopeptide repeat protein [Wenxinia marina DSM 24838]GGL62977.1 hypothetical protein GCM10011392_17060 [Wenxinia marina]